ncbi:MAG: IreB family regulatory phosphoprotein [Oscillospiraceae bacterium]|nr:IreB family regulatory phosphoprotein [Oscillospiraceae bacterium]MBQ8929093.1 IreB family regulatory phosphoprotein [Oscillospiraceae bacterium]MBR6430747.1 IreB family regulatory phosphoprotein [Oscillospiraceae bacterium]
MYFSMDDLTRKFDVVSNDADSRTILRQVYESLRLKGYNPINQIVGYILSEDPTYITNYNNARSLICKLDRDELLREMVVHYLNQ